MKLFVNFIYSGNKVQWQSLFYNVIFFPQLEFNLYMITMGLHLFNSFKNVEIQK